MKMYKITSAKGVHLCYQYGMDEADAVRLAKMYGKRSAAHAILIDTNAI